MKTPTAAVIFAVLVLIKAAMGAGSNSKQVMNLPDNSDSPSLVDYSRRQSHEYRKLRRIHPYPPIVKLKPEGPATISNSGATSDQMQRSGSHSSLHKSASSASISTAHRASAGDLTKLASGSPFARSRNLGSFNDMSALERAIPVLSPKPLEAMVEPFSPSSFNVFSNDEETLSSDDGDSQMRTEKEDEDEENEDDVEDDMMEPAELIVENGSSEAEVRNLLESAFEDCRNKKRIQEQTWARLARLPPKLVARALRNMAKEYATNTETFLWQYFQMFKDMLSSLLFYQSTFHLLELHHTTTSIDLWSMHLTIPSIVFYMATANFAKKILDDIEWMISQGSREPVLKLMTKTLVRRSSSEEELKIPAKYSNVKAVLEDVEPPTTVLRSVDETEEILHPATNAQQHTHITPHATNHGIMLPISEDLTLSIASGLQGALLIADKFDAVSAPIRDRVSVVLSTTSFAVSFIKALGTGDGDLSLLVTVKALEMVDALKQVLQRRSFENTTPN